MSAAAEVTTYRLWINGMQVTSENADNITEGVTHGTVSYDPDWNVLTLYNAALTCSTAGNIRSDIPGLRISVHGGAWLTTSGENASLRLLSSATITGQGSTMICNSPDLMAARIDRSTLTLEHGVHLQLNGAYGLYGTSTDSKLVMNGYHTKLTANGTNGSIMGITPTLNDGLVVALPEGATFDGSRVVDAAGALVKDEDVVISQPIPNETYGIWINGVEVTDLNKGDLSVIKGVTGSVFYNPQYRTLVMSNATINCDEVSTGEEYFDDAIKVTGTGVQMEIEGNCTISNTHLAVSMGIRSDGLLRIFAGRDGATLNVTSRFAGIYFTGEGCLDMTSPYGKDVTVRAEGERFGINGSASSATGRLSLRGGEKTRLYAKGGTRAGIFKMPVGDFTSTIVMEPAGARFNADGTVVDADGNEIVDQWVVIGERQKLPGDVDGSGAIDVDDLNIVINIILGKTQASSYPGIADVDGNSRVDVDDMNAIINIMLGK